MLSETNAHMPTDLMELWRDWNETIIRIWPSLLECGQEASRASLGFYTFWMKGAGIARGQLKTSPVDPVEVWKQWTDAVFDIWRAAMETSTGVVGTFYWVHEELFKQLQLPTRSDITRLEGHIASLEERVYTIEEAFVHFEDGYLKVATDQVEEALAEYLERVAGKLDTLDVLSSSSIQRTEMLKDLAGRLERVEDKLNILLETWQKLEARAQPEAIKPGDGGEIRHKHIEEA